MQKITPHLWFDYQAEEAVQLYMSLFKDSKINLSTRYTKAGFEIHHQPEGKIMTMSFELAGQSFMALNGGPLFKFTPAISFLVACDSVEEVDALWAKLNDQGKTLMPLEKYPFSDRYGWTEDRFGLSWQIMLQTRSPITQKITPTLMFVGDQCGKAEQAINFYTQIFEHSKINYVMRYGANASPDQEGTISHTGFSLENQDFAAMDSAREHKFTFTEAISFLVSCETQEEIDYYWDKLTDQGDPKAQQCGWLKDKFGLSWQIAPAILGTMLQTKDQAKVMNVTNAFMKMKKLDIAELQKAYEGK